ncbi:MAG: sugar phosphate isomerase/epimerase family protein [Phycisphaerales bacterium]
MEQPAIGRRAMLGAIAAAAGGAILGGCAAAKPAAGATSAGASGTRPPYVRTISLAQWSLHRAVESGQTNTLGFAPAARRIYGIGAIEYVSTLYGADPGDAAYARQLRGICDGEGVRSNLIMIDAEGDLGDPDPALRARAVERHARWLEPAAALGCFCIRVNARSSGTPDEQRARCAEGIAALAERAKALKLDIIVENHGGISSDGAWMASLMRAIGRPDVGTLPDFGNFRLSRTQNYDRYEGIRQMLPWARDVSAKTYDFDEAGNETTIDYARMFALLDAAGYSGPVGIEYEGKRLSERDGILATKRLVERFGARA